MLAAPSAYGGPSCTARASASLFNFGERLELIGAATHFAAVVVHPTELGYLCCAMAFKLTCFTHDVLLYHQSDVYHMFVWRLFHCKVARLLVFCDVSVVRKS